MDFNTICLLLSTLLTIFILRWMFQRIYNKFHYTYPPGPKGWPLVANTFDFELRFMHLSIWDHKNKYGDVSHVNVTGFDFVFLNTIEAMREAMLDAKYKKVFSGRPKTFFSEYVLNDDLILSSYNEKWAKLRKIVHTAITQYSQDEKRIENVINNELRFLKKDLDQMEERPFDIQTHLAKSTANIVFILITGERFGYDHEIHGRAKSFLQFEVDNNFDMAILTLMPWLCFVPFGVFKRAADWKTNMEQIVQQLSRNVGNVNTDTEQGLLYEMLRQQKKHSWLTDANVRAVIMDMIFAGIVTTSRSLYALFLILLYKPDVLARLQAEIDDEIGKDRDPSLDDQARMPFTRAVILETLRFASSVPVGVFHTLTDDVAFRGFNLKKGTVVIPNAFLIHHDSDTWDEPWEFKPDRFLDADGQLHAAEHKSMKNLVMFGLGNRRCIGDVFARNRMFLFVTHILQKFSLYTDHASALPSMDPRDYLNPSGILTPKPYQIQLSARG